MSTLHDRLAQSSHGLSFRRIAKLTGVHPETARRYMQGQSPSVEFLTSYCEQLGVSTEWLLRGNGPSRVDQLQAHALSSTRPAELMQALGGAMERIMARLDRLEGIAQTRSGLNSNAHVAQLETTAA